jgi:hypothetical protein
MAFDVFTGPRCRFTVNGVTIALGRDVSAQEEIVYDPLEVLNNIEVAEHVPVGYRAGMGASQIMQVNQTLEALNIFPKKGQDHRSFLRNILTLPDLVGQVEDEISDIVVARVLGVKLASRNFAVNARGSVPAELGFVARRAVSAEENV